MINGLKKEKNDLPIKALTETFYLKRLEAVQAHS